MSLLSDSSLCLDNCVTYGALLTVGKTGFGTGCCLAGYGNLGVTGSGKSLSVAVATVLAGEGLNARTLAGRSSSNYTVIISVAKSGNYYLSLDNCITNGAVRACGKTGFGTGGSYSRVSNYGVTGSGNSLGVGVATVLTGEGLNARTLAGRSSSNYTVIISVAGSGICINNGIGCAASVVTGSGLRAVFGAGCVVVGSIVRKAVANGNSLAAADVTDSILAIGVGVVALNGKSAKNLSRYVSIAKHLCVSDVNVEYVSKLKRKCEGIHRGDGSYEIKNVVSVNGLTANGNNGIDGCVDHSIDKLALVNDKGCDVLAGDGYGDVLCLNDLACKCTNVGVSSGDEISDHSLCLVTNGKLEGNNVVNRLVVLAKSDVGHLYNVGKDGNRLNACNSVKYSDDLGRHSYVGIAKLCKNVCKSECYLVDNEVVVNVEAVVVTKSGNCSVGVNCVDGKHGLVVVKVVRNVLVKCGVSRDGENVHYGDLYGVVCVLAKLIVEEACLKHLNVACEAEHLCVSVKKLNNVYGVSKYVGSACRNERIVDHALCLLYVGKVILTNEACPIKSVNTACKVGCNNLVDSAVKSRADLLDTCGSKYASKGVCHISVKVCAKSSVKILACKADSLCYCVVDSGSAAICNGDKVCASDISRGNGIHSNLLVLVSAKVKSLCDDVSIAVVSVNDCKIEGVLGKLDLTGNDTCNILADSNDDLCDHLVGVGLGVAAVNECVYSLDKTADLSVNLSDNSCDLVSGCGNVVLKCYDSSLKSCYCSVKLSLCVCDSCCKVSLCCLDSCCKLCLNSCDSRCKLCLNSCDLGKDSCLSLTDSSLKLLSENEKLILSLCLEGIDLKLCLCLEGVDLSLCLCLKLVNVRSSVYDSNRNKSVKIVYVSGKSRKKLGSLCKGLSVDLVGIVDEVASLLDGSLCICKGVRKRGSELCALDVLGILGYPSLSEVNGVNSLVKVCVNHIDNASLESLVVCYLVSLVVVLCDKVCKHTEVLKSLVLCGVIRLVSVYDNLKEVVVTCGSGVNGHSVTDLEKTVNLTHCLTGRRGEPVYKCIVDVVRSGALGKDLGHSAKCFENSISAACNTQKTAKSDLHSIDARYNGCLNSKIDNGRNFLFKLVCVGR